MSRHRQTSRGKAAAALGLAVLTVLSVTGGRPALSNDIDLLRFDTAKPYVFILLDTSASMTQAPDGAWVHANGDDPRSKIYQAKRVLYEVFNQVNDVQFGFASFNQDNVAVVAKHWLYYNRQNLPAASSWPVNWPRPDADGPVQYAADSSAISDVEGDLMTFGKHLDATGIAGTCAAPISLSAQVEKINRYSMLGANGNGPTYIWLTSGTGGSAKTYRLTVERKNAKQDGSANPQLGKDSMQVAFTLQQVSNCNGPNFNATFTLNRDLELWTDFLMYDENTGNLSPPNSGNASGGDPVAGFWAAKDVNNVATCGSGHPFSGSGWEGNYDGSIASGETVPGGVSMSNQDQYCKTAGVSSSCYNVRNPTAFSSFGRPLDMGDVIPFDWGPSHKEDFLNRLAPSAANGSPDFRIASYYSDTPDAASGVLGLRDSSQSPLVGTGPSPLGKSVIDFRCWYMGDGNKCNTMAYNPGFESIAQRNDKAWGCRRPYLIVISDGGDSCAGENPCADTANLNSKGSVRTWVVAYGADCSKAGNPLKCMAQNGKGELVCPQTANDLKTELQRILGLIREEARSFASAAVPSVQAIVEDKVFLTNFTPLNGKSMWDGHVHSFLKPLPLRETDNRPDITSPNHLWDAGEVMKTQINASDPLGNTDNQRRVYYTQEVSAAEIGATGSASYPRRLLKPVKDADFSNNAVQARAARRDLWDAFDLPYIPDDSVTEALAETRSLSVMTKTFALKTHTGTMADPVTGNPVTRTIQYILGDIFHSNPLVVGSPPNIRYYAEDTAENPTGYRDYFRQQELRRKMLLVGSNDGMLHVFDAGIVHIETETDPVTRRLKELPQFDNGTGKELFAFMPRTAMPAVRKMAEGTNHQWGVDGTVAVADVKIDPLRRATPVRSWRTVVVGGLREGGAAVYALDVTQPDKIRSDQLFDGRSDLDYWIPTAAGSYRPSCSEPSTECGPVPFPYPLWEFTDSVRSLSTGKMVSLDEDLNAQPDLGYTWSVPNVGRIRIKEGTKIVDRYVVVFGGGFDPGNKEDPRRGNWIYMVDAETGQAIYKRKLDGAAPSEPAAVDVNQDGYLDRIYIGTTFGYMYRMDLGKDAAGNYPALEDTTVRAVDGSIYTVQRIPSTSWAARKIFNANFQNGVEQTGNKRRPIFYRPSVIFVARLGLYALSFGTGDREDLWSGDATIQGRFYVFVDDTDTLASGTVLDERTFDQVLNADDPTNVQTILSSANGRRGWYIVLDPDERVITDAFALSGVSFFSSFRPDVQVTGGKDPLCSKTGTSRVYILSTVNGNAFMGSNKRYFNVSTFVTNPYTEQGQTRNPEDTGHDADDFGPVGSDEAQRLLGVMESLKTLFPSNCKFSNYRIDIKTISADTGVVFIAPVPICMVEKNWKDLS